MWKPLLLLAAQVGIFFSIVFYIGLSGDTSWIAGSITLVLSLVGFWFAARSINKTAQ